ncbi:MAG: hypothetical protein MJ180_02790, partial [Candidatus Gastranaerophilales bacterium]|nr:hypothetical protein [Candidatus Gastranaerophilales bacterium]
MTNKTDDTISAISTVLGNAGVGIIRLSGENSKDIINKIFFANKNFKQVDFKPNSITHGFIFDNKTLIDEVIVLYFENPH